MVGSDWTLVPIPDLWRLPGRFLPRLGLEEVSGPLSGPCSRFLTQSMSRLEEDSGPLGSGIRVFPLKLPSSHRFRSLEATSSGYMNSGSWLLQEGRVVVVGGGDSIVQSPRWGRQIRPEAFPLLGLGIRIRPGSEPAAWLQS